MKKYIPAIIAILAITIMLNTNISGQTAFSYQGSLKSNGQAANGTFDLQFRLYDAEIGGNQVGNTVTKTGLTVTNGIYSTLLDFGNNFSSVSPRYLEVTIRQTGAPQYTVLTPRQVVASVPVAIRSLSAETANIADVAVNANQLEGLSSTSFVRNQTNTQTGNFAVNGTGSANILNAFTQFNLGGQKVLSAPASQSTFVGIGAGQNNGSGFSNTFVGSNAGQNNQVGDENSFFGMNAGQATTGNLNTFIGRGAGVANVTGSSNTVIGANANVINGTLTNATAIGAGTIAAASDTIQLGRDTIDSVRIGRLGSGGSTAVCLNTVNGFATCSSSIRYKSNVTAFSSGLDLIKKLRPVSFNWKADNKIDLGLVAEEVADAEPLLTIQNNDGQVEGVKYDRIGVVLVNAVQEQQAQIEVQRALIEQQRRELEMLKAIICSTNAKAVVCTPNN